MNLLGQVGRVFVSCFRNRGAFRQNLYNTRHPTHRVIRGDKAQCNHYASICGVSSYE